MSRSLSNGETSSDSILGGVVLSIRMLSKRTVRFGWRLLEFCYLDDQLKEHDAQASTKMFPAKVEDPMIRGDILVQTLKDINREATCSSQQNPGKTFLQALEKEFQLMSRIGNIRNKGCVASPTVVNVDDHTGSEDAMGYTMTQICDKFIVFFMYEKPQTKDWRKILVYREEWRRYRPRFYKHCQMRIDMETDSSMKQKLVVLARKVKKIDDEIEKHMELFTELRENPTDINAIVARRRKDFTGEFFRHLNFLLNAYNGLDERDAIVRLGAKCLSAIHAYDCTLEQLDIDSAQSKFDDILNSSSLDDACDKIKSLAKAKELDSSLILLINRAWAAAKHSKTMKNEVKDIMYHIYTTTKESLKSISPPEMKLLKYLLNIEDPEERFGALATAFSPGDEHEVKDEDALYTTPNELHKWIKMMLDSYHLNKEEMDFMDARKMSDPIIIQRLILLKETIEEEYMKQYIHPEEQDSEDQESEESEESEE